MIKFKLIISIRIEEEKVNCASLTLTDSSTVLSKLLNLKDSIS